MVRRRAFLGSVCLAGVLLVVGSLLLPSGCSTPPRLTGTLQPNAQRSQRLLALAAQEASSIPDVDVRLTRQLNIASRQISHGWKADAASTLAATRQTLASADAGQLNDHARISGWVSTSELSRRIQDTAGAIAACDGGIAAMRALDDPAKRCDYAMGLANELQYLRGLGAAAELLVEAAPWTRDIDHLERRRQATVSFASALFNLDSYASGQMMLQQDDDPIWRSDTLVSLACLGSSGDRTPTAVLEKRADSVAAPSSPVPFFGKQLNYEAVFENQQRSQTTAE